MRILLSILAMLHVSRGYLSLVQKSYLSAPRAINTCSLLKCSFSERSPLKSSHRMSMSTETGAGYLSVHVKGLITPGATTSDIFYRNTLLNAQNSILESGISRFDVLNRIDNKDEFLLVEVYNSETGPSDHKLTAHYNSWRENVADLMAQPRTAAKYTTLFPPRSNWKTDSSASIVDDQYMKNIPWTQEPHIRGVGRSETNPSMLAVAVDVEVTEGGVEEFIAATLINCRTSIKEPGVTRFDFMQNNENPRNFLLFEVYNNPDGPVEHKATAHYATWAANVKDLMARPRTGIRYATKFPAPLYWHRNSFLTHTEQIPKNYNDKVEVEVEGADRGFSGITGQSFGFIGPKLQMGRGIAVSAIKTALKDLRIKKPFIVTGKNGFIRLKESLFIPSGAIADNINSSDYAGIYCISGEPTVENAREATAMAQATGCDGVLAVGGGSAIDLGKAVAALMTNPGDVFDYLEIIGKGQPITEKPMPLIAVPTTSGTGSEVTKNAVLKSVVHGRKASMRHESMLPIIAIIDPCLSISCPQQVTAHVGLDTLCQVIEPYTSNSPNPIVDALAKEGILRAARSLRAVVANGEDLTAREDLAIASVFGGLCLANSKLGAVHGYAAVLGGMYDTASHGAICAVLLPHVFRKNAEKLEILSNSGDVTARLRLQRFIDVSRIITGLENATIWQGITWIETLVRDLNIPSLSNMCEIKMDEISAIAQSTAESSSTKGNPVVLSVEELENILKEAF